MKKINLEQGSEEWKRFRLNHITSTDVACILGINPWKDSHTLWQEKIEMILPDPVNDRMRRGNILEPVARDLLCEHLGIEFEPIVVVHDTEFWAMASLDGISSCEQFICEIKCPGKDAHELAIQGEIKPYYMSQIQHALWVTNCVKCYYCSYLPDHKNEIVIIEITPRQDYIKNMIEKEKEFFFETMCNMEPTRESWTLKEKVS